MLAALTGHPLVRLKAGLIDAAGDDIKAAKWKYFPSVTVDSGRRLGSDSQAISKLDPNAGTYRIQQPLWTGGRVSSEIDMAESRLSVAESALAETEQDLMLRVAQSYSDFQRFKERYAVALSNLNEHNRLEQLITRRKQQGLSSEADVALARARHKQTSTELVAVKTAWANARSALEQLLGQRLPEVQMADMPERRLSWHEADLAYDEAENYSSTLRRLRNEVEVAKAEADNKKAQLLPQLNLRYEKFTGSAYSLPSDRLMLAMEYQPGSGMSSYAVMEGALKKIAVAEESLEAGKRDLRDKIFAAFNEALSYADQAESSRSYADSATAVMESYLRQYTIGRKSWLEVLNAQREMAQAQTAAIDVRLGSNLSNYKLDLLTGRLNRSQILSSTK